MSADDPRCRCGDGGTCGGACGDGAPGDTGTPPGDPARFRHSAVLDRMLDRIARSPANGGRPLSGLSVRDTDDPAIALLSAAAGTAHVLGWTLNRLYLDGTLPGTRDRAALASLTGLLGYEPRPAISATTVLSFHLDTVPGAPVANTVPAGTKVASVPVADGEQPLTFETDAGIEVRSAWNAVRPLRAPAPQVVDATTTRIVVRGVGSGARTGDRVLVWTSRSGNDVTWLLARIVDVTVTAPDPAAGPAAVGHTVVTVAPGQLVTAPADRTGDADAGSVILLGGHARAFGATAPDVRFMPEEVERDGTRREWKDFRMAENPAEDSVTLHLNATHPEAAAGRVAVFDAPAVRGGPMITRIGSAHDTARRDFGLSAACTLVSLDKVGKEEFAQFDLRVRETAIDLETARPSLLVGESDPLLPITGAGPQHPSFSETGADRFYVVGPVALPPGRRVVLTDGRAMTVEVATVARSTVHTVSDDGSGLTATLLEFDAPLALRLPASELVVLANTVGAAHGESPPGVVAAPGTAPGTETLGSGDPSVVLPRYPLARAPLTHVPAPGPSGYAPALEVRVADRRYDAAGSLYGEGPGSRRYRVLSRRDGRSEIQFGGRLPTGAGTVTAWYRTGGGAAGNLAAGRLTQILTPVVGVRSAAQPVPADGGSDAATADEIRSAAPRSIRTLDRAVAVADFEAMAESYRGVGKAAAVELRSGMHRVVVVTVATTTLAPPVDGSDLVSGLRDALLAAAAPGTHLRIAGFTDIRMTVRIALATDPALRRGTVEADVRARLVRDLGRAARRFGEAVHRSQVLASVQAVPGVVAALLTGFTADPAEGGVPVVEDAHGRLPCPGPVLGGATVTPAGLLSVAATDVHLTEFPT